MEGQVKINSKVYTGTAAKRFPGLLEDKVAIITGSSRGIGKATAKIFAEHGAKVVIIGRNAEVCNQVVEEIERQGGVAIAASGDITDENFVKEMIETTINAFGTIDVLVNNAGTSEDSLIHKMSDESYQKILDLTLKGAHLTTQAVLPYFTDAKRVDEFKKIINVASTIGITGNLGQSNYGMAKSGVIAYSKACARELCLQRINVNVIAPGFTATRMTKVKQEDDILGIPVVLRNIAISATPFARENEAGQPEHMANVMLFLASGMSDWMTGQIITVDGGMLI